MAQDKRPAPLELAKRFRVPQREVAARVDASVSWLRILARDPRHATRIRLAEIEAILEAERARHLIEAALDPLGTRP